MKKCETNPEAEIWLSPGGDTPEGAIRLAAEKFKGLVKARQVCFFCGNVGSWPAKDAWEWCPKCKAEGDTCLRRQCEAKTSGVTE